MAGKKIEFEFTAEQLAAINKEASSLDNLFQNISKNASEAIQKQIEANQKGIESLQEKIKFDKEYLDLVKKEEPFNTALINQANRTLNMHQNTLNNLIAQNASLFKQKDFLQERDDLLKNAAKNSGELYNQAYNLYKAFSNLKNPTMFWAQLIEMSAGRFFELDKAAEQFRKETGLVASQTRLIDANARTLSRNFTAFGVSIEEAYKSAKALTDTFGDQMITSSEENMEFTSLMATNLGISEEESAKTLQNFMGLGKMSSESARNLSLGAVSLAKAAGIPIGKVMHDVANASGDTLVMLRGSVKELIKGSVEARRLGTDIEKVASAGRKMLDFQSSISDEMEASVLMGKNLNLQHARELAYRGDMVNLAKEQNRILQSAGDLNKMDMFQQDALAKSLGMSTDEMFKRVAKQQELNELQSKFPDLAKKYNEAQKALDGNQKSLEERYKEELLVAQVQSTQTKLANQLKAIFVSISDLLYPILYPLNIIADYLMKLSQITNGWSNALLGYGILFAVVATKFRTLFFTPIKKGWESLTGMFKKTPFIGPPSPTATSGGFVDNLKKSVQGIKPTQLLAVGAAMIAFAGSLFIMAKAAKEFGSDSAQKGFKNMAIIATGLVAFSIAMVLASSVIAEASPILAIAGAVLIGFGLAVLEMGYAAKLAGEGIDLMADGFVKLKDLSFRNIAKSIVALSLALFSFGAAMAVGGMMSFLGGGMMLQLMGLAMISPLLSKSADALMEVSEALTNFKDKETISGINAVTKAIKELNSEIEKTNTLKVMAITAMTATAASTGGAQRQESDTAAKLDELINLMKNGAIAVNIDGTRASYLLAKTTKERGSLGTIK
jgi:hypothetical protein